MFTDGDFNVGVTETERLEDYRGRQAQGTGIYLSVYSFGRGNYRTTRDADHRPGRQRDGGLCRQPATRRAACSGRGLRQRAFPIADDVKIQVEFNPARVAEVPADRLRDPAAERGGLQQRPRRRGRGGIRRVASTAALRDHPRRRAQPDSRAALATRTASAWAAAIERQRSASCRCATSCRAKRPRG